MKLNTDFNQLSDTDPIKIKCYEYLLNRQTNEMINLKPISYDECINNILNVQCT